MERTATATHNASLISSAAMDLLLVVPRLAQRAGSFALFHMPEAMDSFTGRIFSGGGSVIADATGQQTATSTITNTSNHFAQSTAAAVLDAALREGLSGPPDDATKSVFGLMLNGFGRIKSFGGIFSYLTSRWAVATFIAAIILNRTQFYASSREHLQLRWYVRLALYIAPICAVSIQLLHILQALRCQTSPDFPLLRYGDPLKDLSIDFGADGGFIHWLSSTLLFWQDDMSCCAARNMSLVALDNDRSQLRGTMDLLFSFFLSLCTSQLFETFACALQGKRPMQETGMTIFEHSLAFAECEAMISSALGFGFFGQLKIDEAPSSTTAENVGQLISRSDLLRRLNVPPEVLLVCVISCFSHLSSAILAVAGLRHKVRLVNSGIWACCYMSAFVWCFSKVVMDPIDNITDLGILRFPTVCIVGFIPHLLVLTGIIICAAIYGLALLITTLSVPRSVGSSLSIGQRLAWAYQNLQANVQFSATSNIRIKMSDDFYTTLLKVGFATLTAASEAVYLNEGSRINVAQMTWLEQKRIAELEASIDKRNRLNVPSELLGDGIAKGVDFTDHHHSAISTSPYARERKSRAARGDQDKATSGELDSGLGLAQRRNRMQLTLDFVIGMFWLLIGVQAKFMLDALRKMGVGYRPMWLLKAAGASATGPSPAASARVSQIRGQEFYVRSPDGRLSVRMFRQGDVDIDVEAEARRRLQANGYVPSEETLGEDLYCWWRTGGWFGNNDNSGDYTASSIDDDTTSMISMSTNASTTEEWSDEDNAGRRTPTREDPHGRRSRESTAEPEEALGLGMLARLLNPQSAAERDEARLLAHSLQSPRPMTRSRYRRETDRDRGKLLLAGRRSQGMNPLSEEEIEQDLEHFIIAKRTKARENSSASATWETGAEGMGAGGPHVAVRVLEHV